MTIVTEHHREIQDAKHWHATAPTTLLLACAGDCRRQPGGMRLRVVKTTHLKSRWQAGVYRCSHCGTKQQQPYRS